MRTHGWGGDIPRTDAEAVARIKAATDRYVATIGAATTVAVVASELGVSRQTVYRYFAGTKAMLVAAAFDGLEPFRARLAARLRHVSDSGEAVVEAIAYTIESVPDEPYLSLLLAGSPNSLITSVTSEAAHAIGRGLLEQTAVDWADEMADADLLPELVEWALRIMQSFLVDPGEPRRDPHELRAFLRRWLAPVVGRVAVRV
jgi:AcrR family transcriptional regulator